jgi:peptide/nickel transport system substrate-binding protein
VPDLATSIPAPTAGGKTYTFTLRSGIRYSNGRPVEPSDIKASIERVLAAKPPSQTRFLYLGEIVGANRCAAGKTCRLSGIVTNQIARTITFHLTAPDPDFLAKLALPTADAVPQGTPARQLRSVPATGPYQIASYSTKRRIIKLLRNPHFAEWSQDAQPAGFPNTIEITWPPPNVTSQQGYTRLTAGVEKGRTDVAIFNGSPPVPKRTLDQLKTRYPSQLRLTLEPATWYFFLNTRVPPFDHLAVRQAVQTAFDRGAFKRLLTPEYSTTCNILPPGYSGYQRSCPYGRSESSRRAKARALVRASGQLGARVVVWTPAPVAFEGRYMVSLLDTLGFHASLHTVPPSQIGQYFIGDILNSRKRIQTGYIGWNADYPSSLAFFKEQLSCAAFSTDPNINSNVAEFCDPRIDAEIKHASLEQVLNPPAATLLWQKLERNLLSLAPLVPTYNGRAIVFTSKRVGNFQYNPQWGVLLDQLWVK